MTETDRMPFPGVIDADGHILEPPDLWERYLEPQYRERAIRIKVDERGREYLELDGKRSKLSAHGTLGFLGGMGKSARERDDPCARAYVLARCAIRLGCGRLTSRIPTTAVTTCENCARCLPRCPSRCRSRLPAGM